MAQASRVPWWRGETVERWSKQKYSEIKAGIMQTELPQYGQFYLVWRKIPSCTVPEDVVKTGEQGQNAGNAKVQTNE